MLSSIHPARPSLAFPFAVHALSVELPVAFDVPSGDATGTRARGLAISQLHVAIHAMRTNGDERVALACLAEFHALCPSEREFLVDQQILRARFEGALWTPFLDGLVDRVIPTTPGRFVEFSLPADQRSAIKYRLSEVRTWLRQQRHWGFVLPLQAYRSLALANSVIVAGRYLPAAVIRVFCESDPTRLLCLARNPTVTDEVAHWAVRWISDHMTDFAATPASTLSLLMRCVRAPGCFYDRCSAVVLATTQLRRAQCGVMDANLHAQFARLERSTLAAAHHASQYWTPSVPELAALFGSDSSAVREYALSLI